MDPNRLSAGSCTHGSFTKSASVSLRLRANGTRARLNRGRRTLFRPYPAHAECTRNQTDRAIGRDRQGGPEPLAQRRSLPLDKRAAVGGSRTLAAEKGRPQIVEVAKHGRHLEHAAV